MTISGGINHVALRVKNFYESEAFYCELVGLKRVESRPGMRFYSSGRYNHELALFEDTALTKPELEKAGMMHLAFNLTEHSMLSSLHKRLVNAGYRVSQVIDHNISNSFYTTDPNGYTVEFTVDRPNDEWQTNANAFDSDSVLDG